MATMRKVGLLVLAVGSMLVALSPTRRALVVQKLTRSRRVVDRDARDQQARDRWEDEGGASRAVVP